MVQSQTAMDRDGAVEAIEAICSYFGIEDDATDEYDGMDPYHILISTIVSQQISEKTTRKICADLFSEFPSMQDVYEADPSRIEGIIRASRFPRQKTCCIMSSTKTIVEDFNEEVPGNLDDLLKLPGVGKKTAACVLRYGFGRATVIVDSHIDRVSVRLGISDRGGPSHTQKCIETIVPEEMWGLLDRGFIALGREFCHPKAPSCTGCPARKACRYAAEAGH